MVRRRLVRSSTASLCTPTVQLCSRGLPVALQHNDRETSLPHPCHLETKGLPRTEQRGQSVLVCVLYEVYMQHEAELTTRLVWRNSSAITFQGPNVARRERLLTWQAHSPSPFFILVIPLATMFSIQPRNLVLERMSLGLTADMGCFLTTVRTNTFPSQYGRPDRAVRSEVSARAASTGDFS
jgi:hypothetical protein